MQVPRPAARYEVLVVAGGDVHVWVNSGSCTLAHQATVRENVPVRLWPACSLLGAALPPWLLGVES